MTETHLHSDYRWLPPVIFLIALAALYVVAMPLTADPDVWWHLAAGKLILSTHHIPKTDPWSFASQGAPWYLMSWLWDIIIALIERSFGLIGVFLFAITFSAALLAMLAYRLTRLAISFECIALTLLLAGFCTLEFATARPHLIGYALALIFHAVLDDSRSRTNYGKLWVLPLLTILWVNMHGSFLVAFSLFAAFIFEAHRTSNSEWKKRLMNIALACMVCLLINPYGPAIITGAFRTLGSDSKQYITEWQPFTFGKSIGFTAWLTVFFLTSNLRIARIPLADKVISFFWLIAMLQSTRHGVVFMLLSAPYFARCLDEQTRDIRMSHPASALSNWLAKQKLLMLWPAVIIIAALSMFAITRLPYDGRLYAEDSSAQDAIEYALQHEPKRRYLNDYDYGGEIIYRTGGELPFFIDSRIDTAYSRETVSDYISFLLQEADWREKLEKYHIDAIIVNKASRFANAYEAGQYRKDWEIAFIGKNANVYIAQH